MKKKIVSAGLLCIFFFSPGVLSAETAKVITKENALREDCRFLSPVKARLKYGDQLEILSGDADWFNARYKNKKGCIHSSAVKEKKISLAGLAAPGSEPATEDEVALAGKGFNPQVEDSYKNRHADLDFRKVDSIEKYRISEEELFTFIRKGGLHQP
ncbi:MAG: hypothetical protein OEW04_05095 [Nitrospirota bacterium]|nr:hypothetical protein [Nitrospirota bacterium]